MGPPKSPDPNLIEHLWDVPETYVVRGGPTVQHTRLLPVKTQSRDLQQVYLWFCGV